MFILERERKRERERTIDVREEHRLTASHRHPGWGPNLQPRYVPELGTESNTFRCTGRWSNQLSHTGQGSLWF